MIVYKTTNLINNKIYVGKDSNDNPNYLGSGLYLKRAIKKYGKENFKKETLEVCDLSNINEREIYWISKLNSRNNDIGYNITSGGDGLGSGKNHPSFGKSLSQDHKNKVSKSMKGRKFSLEHKKHLSEKRKGITFSEETKRKMSLAKLGRCGYWANKKRPLKTRQKMSKAHKLGFLLNPERYL